MDPQDFCTSCVVCICIFQWFHIGIFYISPGKDFIKRICRILAGIIETVSDQGTKSKSIVQQSTQDAIQVAVNLLPVYINQPGM